MMPLLSCISSPFRELQQERSEVKRMVTASNRVYKGSYEASADPLIDCLPFLPAELANLSPAHPLHRHQPPPPPPSPRSLWQPALPPPIWPRPEPA